MFNHLTESGMINVVLSHKTSSNQSAMSWPTAHATAYNPYDQEGNGEGDPAQNRILEKCGYLSIYQGGLRCFCPPESVKQKQTSWDGWASLTNERSDPRLPRRPRWVEDKKEERHSTHTVNQKYLNDNCLLCLGHRASKCKSCTSSQCCISK